MYAIIAGAGVVGRTLASHLTHKNWDVVVIDLNASRLERIQERLDVQIIQGEAADLQILRQAGLAKADLLLAVTNSDEKNIIITLFAQSENNQVRCIIRVRGDRFAENQDFWRGGGFERTWAISPERAAVEKVMSLVEMEQAFDVIPFLNGRILLAGFRLLETSPVIGKKLKEIPSGPHNPTLVAAIHRAGEVLVPHGEQTVQAADLLYIASLHGHGPENALRFLGESESNSPGSVIIAGGGWMAAQVAKRLENSGRLVTLIERDAERCRTLAANLENTEIILGEFTNAELLREFCRPRTAFLALTGDEEINFVSSLLAMRLGISRTITLLDNQSYMEMASAMGLHAIVSPKQSSVGSILRFLSRGKVLDAASLFNESHEALLVEVQEHSPLAGIPLKEIPFPKGCLVVAGVQGEKAMIPNGSSIFNKKDQILLLIGSRMRPEVEKILESRSPP